MEQIFYVLAIVLNMVPFSVFRYYPFRHSLRIPLAALLLLYSMVLCAEVACYLYFFETSGGDAFFDKDTIVYDIFILFYVGLSFAVIRENVFKQLFIWFTLALYELAVFGAGVWVESAYQSVSGAPRFLLLDITVVLLLILSFPLCRYIMWRLEPFLQLKRPELWRWSWGPGAAFFFMNALYVTEKVHYFGDLVVCRMLSLAAALLCLGLLLWAFDEQHRQNILRQRFLMTQSSYERQESAAQEERENASRTEENYRHLQNIIDRLQECAEQQDAQQAHRVIEAEQTALLLRIPEQHFCQHEILDVILCHTDIGIRTEVRVKFPGKLVMDDLDICVLFGNLLENALQGCKMLPQNSRWLTLHISAAGSMLVVTLDNSCLPESVRQAGEMGRVPVFYSAKRDYAEPGLGISSICDIAAKCGGEAEFKCRDGGFYASVVLPKVCSKGESGK